MPKWGKTHNRFHNYIKPLPFEDAAQINTNMQTNSGVNFILETFIVRTANQTNERAQKDC